MLNSMKEEVSNAVLKLFHPIRDKTITRIMAINQCSARMTLLYLKEFTLSRHSRSFISYQDHFSYIQLKVAC